MYLRWKLLSGDEKNGHLKQFDKASENLLLLKAELLGYDALAAAIAGCKGVFHIASPFPSTKLHDSEARYHPIWYFIYYDTSLTNDRCK